MARKESFLQQPRDDHSPVCPGNEELLGLLGSEVQGAGGGGKSQSQGLKGQALWVTLKTLASVC